MGGGLRRQLSESLTLEELRVFGLIGGRPPPSAISVDAVPRMTSGPVNFLIGGRPPPSATAVVVPIARTNTVASASFSIDFIVFLLVRRLNRRGVVNERVTRM